MTTSIFKIGDIVVLVSGTAVGTIARVDSNLFPTNVTWSTGNSSRDYVHQLTALVQPNPVRGNWVEPPRVLRKIVGPKNETPIEEKELVKV